MYVARKYQIYSNIQIFFTYKKKEECFSVRNSKSFQSTKDYRLGDVLSSVEASVSWKWLSDHHSTIDCLIKMENCSFLGQKLRAQKPPDTVVVMKTGQKARKKIKFSEESIICLTKFHKAVQISSEKPIEPLRKPGKWSPRMYPTKNRFHTKWHLSSCQTISFISGIKSQESPTPWRPGWNYNEEAMNESGNLFPLTSVCGAIPLCIEASMNLSRSLDWVISWLTYK